MHLNPQSTIHHSLKHKKSDLLSPNHKKVNELRACSSIKVNQIANKSTQDNIYCRLLNKMV